MSGDNPFLDLVVECLNLLHPRFAARGQDLHAVRAEFYHQFRHLWDRALPVQLGLGHVLTQPDPTVPPESRPDFTFWQLGEHGRPDARLGAVTLTLLADGSGTEAALATLARLRREPGYSHGVAVILGTVDQVPETGLPGAEGVSIVFFDTNRWAALII